MAESLREQLEANFDKIMTVPDAPAGDDTPVATPAETVETAPREPASSKIVEAPKAKAAVADDRPRAPDGKFLPKDEAQAKAADVPSAAKIHPAKPQVTAPEIPIAPAVPVKPKAQRPSSWKKEHWGDWEKLAGENPQLAEYLHQRESQYASGVSTYKAEAEAAKPILEAMQPFMAELKQHNLEPTRWIGELGNVHRMLALGTPQQKMQTLAQVAQAYGVPLQAFSDQNVQQQYLAQAQFQRPYQPPQQQTLTPEAVNKIVQERLVQANSEQELTRFAADTAKHPYFDEVRNTMAQLLEANLADDLESAYDTALAHPRHSNLREAIQQQAVASQEEQRRAAEAVRVQKAKAKAVSIQSATPSGGTEDRPKGLRASLEDAWDQHAGGRV
mgnify:CR=1 FL=1